MKKSSKPFLFLLVITLLISTSFMLVSIGIKLKYERYLLDKDKAEKKYKSEKQKQDKLTADYQMFIAEERIVSIANSELGMIRSIQPDYIIKYDRIKIEEINEVLKEKYE